MPTPSKKEFQKTVHLLLGGNLGDRVEVLKNAKKLIDKEIGGILKGSNLYETAPWGKEDQNAFLNQVLLVATTCSPEEILSKIQYIENELGRVRFEKWGERLIDIDILFIEDEIITRHDLKVPHPYIQERRFTLVPLAEISPEFIHPIFNKSVQALLMECTDRLEVSQVD